jgi:hypothetical protein
MNDRSGEQHMNRISLSIVTAVLFFAAAAFAQYSNSQTSGRGSQDSTATTSRQGSSGMQGSDNSTKGEHKLTGCVRSTNGEYLLETKKGKSVPLAGQDVSAHVGHTVAVHGTWSSAGSSESSMSSGSGAKGEKSFNVSSVDMISDSCSADKMGKSSKQ